MAKLINLTGRVFGRLTVRRRNWGADGRPEWWCICQCGKEKSIRSSYLLNGDTTSCGCIKKQRLQENPTRLIHGARYTTEYKIWGGIKQRCLNPKDKAYSMYGGRGISICQEWADSFEVFLSDMGSRPSKLYTLDRGDNDGPYSKDNCRWATWTTQNNNQRSNRYIEHLGRTQTMAEWAREFGINYTTFKWYVRIGKSMEDIEKKRKT